MFAVVFHCHREIGLAVGGNKELTTNILWVYTDVSPALLVSSRFIVTRVQTPVLVQFQGVIAETG